MRDFFFLEGIKCKISFHSLRFFFGLDKILKLSLHVFIFFKFLFDKVDLLWKGKKKIIFLMFLDVVMGLFGLFLYYLGITAHIISSFLSL